ncbi:MAG: hypothetical protein K2H01_04920 [Ruminococcus sp.]|nr:hypothetical protein [Ruminococcus sp.]
MRSSKKLLACMLAALNIGAIFSSFPVLSASAEEEGCCCEMPYVSQEEIDAYKAHFASKNSDSISKIQQYSTQSLPSSVDLSTSPYFPPIGNQQQVGSCVAWSTTYYQFTFAANKLNNITSTESTAYSPRWVYNWLNGGNTGNGISFFNAYYVLEHQGCLTMSECPYMNNGSYDTSISTNTEAMVRALNTRLTYYNDIILNTKTNPITSPTDTDLNQIKALLNSGYILQVSTDWNHNYKRTTGTVSPNEWAIYECHFGDGHAMSVVGYNDNIQCDINGNGIIEEGEKGAFKVANSHGTGYRNNGFVWVMYDALNETSRYASNVDRIPVFYGVCGWEENQFNYIEVGNQPVNTVALLDINTSNIYNYIIETTSSDSVLYEKAEKYTVYDGRRSKYWLSGRQKIPFNGVLAFDYGALDEPASNFTSKIKNILGLHITKRSDTDSTETISKLTICDNKMNTIYTTNTLLNIQNSNLFKCRRINLSKGDLNYDNILTSDDATILLRFLAEQIAFSDMQFYLADMNGDNAVSVVDLTALRKLLPTNEQAALLENMNEIYNNMSIEEKAAYSNMFSEIERSIKVDINSTIE